MNFLSVTTYISLYVGAKRLVFHLSPRDGHVIIVSGCLILTAVNLIVLIQMAYITKTLVKLCKIYCNIWHRLTWSVCTGGRAVRRSGVRYVITKFSRRDSLPNFLTHGAPLLKMAHLSILMELTLLLEKVSATVSYNAVGWCWYLNVACMLAAYSYGIVCIGGWTSLVS